VRAISPLRVVRPVVSGTVLDVVGETKLFNFGGVEAMLNGSITIANANFIPVPMPPVIIGPDQSALLYLWQNVGGDQRGRDLRARAGILGALMHLILQTIDGVPSFYSLEAGRAVGSLHGWSQERDKALQFEREKDAQGFVNAFLPNVAPFATVVEIKPATAPA
jgi:hypothetical protein